MIERPDLEYGLGDPFDCTIAFSTFNASPRFPRNMNASETNARYKTFDCQPTYKIAATCKNIDLWLVGGRAWGVANRIYWRDMLRIALKVGADYGYYLVDCDSAHERAPTAHIEEYVLEMMHFRMAILRTELLYPTISDDDKIADVDVSLKWGYMGPVLEFLLTELLREYSVILKYTTVPLNMDVDYTNRMEEFMH